MLLPRAWTSAMARSRGSRDDITVMIKIIFVINQWYVLVSGVMHEIF
jgi:hypothetical protein